MDRAGPLTLGAALGIPHHREPFPALAPARLGQAAWAVPFGISHSWLREHYRCNLGGTSAWSLEQGISCMECLKHISGDRVLKHEAIRKTAANYSFIIGTGLNLEGLATTLSADGARTCSAPPAVWVRQSQTPDSSLPPCGITPLIGANKRGS